MRSRAPALITVVVFAVAVALVALVAGQGGGDRLVKLPAGSPAGTAADESAPAPGALSSRSALMGAGAVEYKLEGTLPDLPSEAPGYRLGSATTVAAVARLAASLGLAGDVQPDATGWVVRTGGRELRVERVAGLPWYVGQACPDLPVSAGDDVVSSCAVAVDLPAAKADQQGATGSGGAAVATAATPAPACGPAADCVAPAPPECESATTRCVPAVPVTPCPPGAACTEPAPLPAPLPVPSCPPDAKCPEAFVCPVDQGCVVPEPSVPPTRPADLPSEDEARTLARETFARMGVDSAGMVVEDGWSAWYARVELRVDGVAVIGMDTSVSIGPKGELVGGNGYLVTPDRIGDYPLVGTAKGLERLKALYGVPVSVLVAGAPAVDPGTGIEPAIAPCGDPATSCTGIPGEQVPVVQTVTGAHLALLHQGDALVPAYVFELADGGSVPVVAVTDEWLDTESGGR